MPCMRAPCYASPAADHNDHNDSADRRARLAGLNIRAQDVSRVANNRENYLTLPTRSSLLFLSECCHPLCNYAIAPRSSPSRTRWPDIMQTARFRMTHVVLAAAHLDSDPTNNRLMKLRAFCQRRSMLHDRPHRWAQRWITYRRRSAVGDLFLGPYPALIAAPRSKRTPQGLGSSRGQRIKSADKICRSGVSRVSPSVARGDCRIRRKSADTASSRL
jgi:hypothetical protein